MELGAHGRPIPEPSDLVWPDDALGDLSAASSSVPLDDRALAALLWLPGETVLRFGPMFAALLTPRLVSIPRPFDAAFGLGLLLATWAGVRDWYVSVAWMDEAVHFLTVGAVAAAAYLMLAKLELMPGPQEKPIRSHRSSVLILAVALGLGVAAAGRSTSGWRSSSRRRPCTWVTTTPSSTS